jgi:hypothetical protein
MQIWLTVLAEGFSSDGRLCFAFEVLLCLHKLARKASNPKVSHEQCLNDKLKDEA